MYYFKTNTASVVVTAISISKFSICKMRRLVFCFFPVDFTTQLAMKQAETAKSKENTTSKIAGKMKNIKIIRDFTLIFCVSRYSRYKIPYEQSITAIMELSIERKIL